MFVTKRALSRRTVLKGMGTTLALPFLESMVPAFQALAQSPARPPMQQESRPLEQAATPSAIASPPTPARSCAGDCCWKLELLAPEPPVGLGQVRVRPDGAWRVVTITNGVPSSPAAQFDRAITEAWATTDTDGTIVFAGHWIGNPDQGNNIGSGIYRVRGGRAEALVDPRSVMPDTRQRFNAFGLPSIELGKLVFWGGRDGGGPSGVYMYEDRKITPIAGANGPVRGTGTPSMRNGSVAFQGEEAGVAGVYVWSPQRGLTRAFRAGDLGITHLFDVSLGDGVVFAGTGMKLYDRRQIVAWSPGGAARVIAAGDDFQDPSGAAMVLQPQPVARGSRVAFTVGINRYSEAWVADAHPGAKCKLVRVATSGDSVGDQRIEMIAGLARDAFTPGGELLLTAVLGDGSARLVRASRR